MSAAGLERILPVFPTGAPIRSSLYCAIINGICLGVVIFFGALGVLFALRLMG